jgi:hypothetical protein
VVKAGTGVASDVPGGASLAAVLGLPFKVWLWSQLLGKFSLCPPV